MLKHLLAVPIMLCAVAGFAAESHVICSAKDALTAKSAVFHIAPGSTDGIYSTQLSDGRVYEISYRLIKSGNHAALAIRLTTPVITETTLDLGDVRNISGEITVPDTRLIISCAGSWNQ